MDKEFFTKPHDFDNYLSEYQAVLVDGICGETTAWGFKIIHYLSEESFNALRKYGRIVMCGILWNGQY